MRLPPRHAREEDAHQLRDEVLEPVVAAVKEVQGAHHAEEEIGADARVDAAELPLLDAREDRLLHEAQDPLAPRR